MSNSQLRFKYIAELRNLRIVMLCIYVHLIIPERPDTTS